MIMLDVIVDGKAVDVALTGEETVGDAIGLVAQDLDEDRCVIAINLDGEDITGLPDRHMRSASDCKRVEMSTGPVSRLAMETLESIVGFNDVLMKEMIHAAEEFRLGGVESSNNLFLRCLDGLQVLLKTTLSVGNLLKLKGEEIPAGDTNLDETTKKFSSLLDEIISAQRSQDTILIADLIEYEMIPLLEDWKNVLDHMQAVGTSE